LLIITQSYANLYTKQCECYWKTLQIALALNHAV